MNLADLWTEVEEEQAWRLDEIRLFQNSIAQATTSEDRADQLRRAIILLLYAHFEGFCKFVFTLYIKAVNDEGKLCGDVNYSLAAASLSDAFNVLRNPEKRCPEFRRALPDDSKLHRFARDREFLERITDFESRSISVPDDVASPESNLKPVVLRKILYRLGFPHDSCQDLEGDIHNLLNLRNRIAHGETRQGVDKSKYQEISASTYSAMQTIKRLVMNSLSTQQYLREPSS